MPNRDTQALRDYHDGTSHSRESLQRDPHHLDWANMPLPFKVYPDLEPIALPRDLASSTRLALDAIGATSSEGAPATSLDLTTLTRLLHFSAGIVRSRRHAAGETYFRAAACTGALYHVDLYVVAGPLSDLEAGVYHFGPHDFALRRLRAGDHRARVVAAAADEASLHRAHAVLVCTSTFWRNAWKYRARTYRHCFWDAGTLLANLLAVAAAVSLPAHVVTGFVDTAIDELLDLDTAREVSLALVALGSDAAVAPVPPSTPALGLATLPLSSHEVAYPAIARAHRESALASAEEVADWRGAAPIAPGPPPTGSTRPLAPLPATTVPEPIETVILRRGSTRRFARAPIGFEELSTILRVATRGTPIDCPIRPDVYVIAHAVDGLAPGAWTFDPERDVLAQLRAGDFRRDAGHLALGQDLAADAAADVFWLVDLDAVLARYGNRGYRAAQLAAAIEGGRTYLAAYALRLGATGLTFFDDDVTAFLSPHAAGKRVLFLAAIGRASGQRERTIL